MRRPFLVLDAEQRSPAWFAYRAGRLTGSCAAAMLATIKSGEAAARRDLRTRLVVERLTGTPQESDYENADMRRGRELEAEARAAYEAHTGLLVQQVGFVAHAELEIGCSPDGVIGDFEGLLELKCPRSANHLRYLRGRCVPSEHRPQLLHALLVTGAAWVDFCSYDPRFPSGLQLLCVRLERTPALEIELGAYEKCVRAFLAECDQELAEAQSLLCAMEG